MDCLILYSSMALKTEWKLPGLTELLCNLASQLIAKYPCKVLVQDGTYLNGITVHK